MSGAGALRSRSLNAYRSLLRAGRSFPDYNVRSYIVRKTRESFRGNRALAGQAAEDALKAASEQLALIHRQSAIAGFYKAPEPSVMDVLGERKRGGSDGARRA